MINGFGEQTLFVRSEKNTSRPDESFGRNLQSVHVFFKTPRFKWDL